jgi:YVTN family beta-propeller protein
MSALFRLGLILAASALATASWAQPVIEKTVKVAPGGLYELAVNPANKDIYVGTTSGEAAVVHLDGRTLAVDGAINTMPDPVFGVGLNGVTQTLYGASTRRGTLVVVDLKSGKVVKTLRKETDDPSHFRGVRVDEQRNKAYAMVYGGPREGQGNEASEIWVIDGASNTVEKIYTPPVIGLMGIALNIRDNLIYGVGNAANEIIVLDAATGDLKNRWPTGAQGAMNVAYDPAGSRLFVTHNGTNNVVVLNATTGAVLSTVATGEGALDVAFNPALNQAYVTNRTAGTTSIIDGATYRVVAALETGTFPQSVVFDPSSNLVYVSNKARGRPRGAPAGEPAPVDERGDTVTIIRP